MDICIYLWIDVSRKNTQGDKTKGKNVLTINNIAIRGYSNLRLMRKRR
jgi:hypothetical protein